MTQPNKILQSNQPGLAIGDWSNPEIAPPPNAGGNPLLPLAVSRPALVNIFNYGAAGDGVTDDTEAMVGMLAAAGALAAEQGGWAHAVCPAGSGFLFGPVTVPNNVCLSCYGATMLPNDSELVAGHGWLGASAALSRFAIRGGAWIGSGTESSYLFLTHEYANTNDLLFQDMFIDGWGEQLYFVEACQRLRILDNTAINLTTNFGDNYINIINFPAHGEQEPADVIVRGNTIIGNARGGCVAFFGNNQAAAAAIRALITDNIFGANGNNAGVIDFEGGAYPVLSQYVVARNLVRLTGPSTGSCILAEQPFGDMDINHNILDGTAVPAGDARGIYFGATPPAGYVSATDNIIRANGGVTIGGTLPTNFYRRGNNYGNPIRATGTLVAGTVTIAGTDAQVGDTILPYQTTPGGAPGALTAHCAVAGSVVVNSTSNTDTSSVEIEVVH